jgi:hypothetical protein
MSIVGSVVAGVVVGALVVDAGMLVVDTGVDVGAAVVLMGVDVEEAGWLPLVDEEEAFELLEELDDGAAVELLLEELLSEPLDELTAEPIAEATAEPLDDVTNEPLDEETEEPLDDSDSQAARTSPSNWPCISSALAYVSPVSHTCWSLSMLKRVTFMNAEYVSRISVMLP